MSTKRSIAIWGLLGVLGGVLAIVADTLSVFSANTDRTYVALSLRISDLAPLMSNKAHWQLVAGHYLAFLAVPLEGAGVIVHSYLGFRKTRSLPALGFLVVGAVLVAWGTAYHATYGLVAEIVRSGASELTRLAAAYYEPLGVALTVALVIYLASWAVAMLFGRTVYPRWMTAVSPFAIMVVSTLVVLILPGRLSGIRAFLTVTAMNLPLLLWVSLSLVFRSLRSIDT